MIECSVCHSKLVSPAATKTVSRAYDRHKNRITSKQRVLNILLVGGDCMLVGFQPILVYMSKVDGKFNFSPISVNFLTEITKVFFAIVMLLLQVIKLSLSLCPPPSFSYILMFHYFFRLGIKRLVINLFSLFLHSCRYYINHFYGICFYHFCLTFFHSLFILYFISISSLICLFFLF